MLKIKNSFIFVLACLLIIGFGRIASAVGQPSRQTTSEVQHSSDSQGCPGKEQNTQDSQRSSGLGQQIDSRRTTNQGSETNQVKGNKEANQIRNQELMRNMEQVRSKIAETTSVRTEIINSSEELKLKIQNRLQQSENISTEDMLRYQAMIQTLSQEREKINEHKGKIQEQVALLSKARLEGDCEAANTAINNIQEEQQLRLAALTKVLEYLKDLQAEIN
ncbi:hypothetical protein Desor_2329 [Desulfosporosinus orientis DSM 765]|uniref:Uncharacterized protein n=1 Tax=Desulfosporosinus orientis (strain ATCC 19365 / DSM 765 / NCIMB 8382 / VKM B-1628 / Singapore I) TaxID=768706 RepID=G7WDF1_DESOD|nr:hypothetical protein [Desulfosporosinus orientis]AET67920.1 hypothetical protein Desor_2329 [Desulfosporosinus orientis DSM 765]